MSPRSPREISVLVPEHLPPLYPDDPTRIGPYLVLGRLGQGATGTVYAAVDASSPTANDRLIAVKVLRDPGPDREALVRRLTALTRVDPTRVVVPTTFDGRSERPWLSMPYMEGERLSHYVTKRGGVGTGKLIALAVGLADGLSALHGRGVAHGSLNPEKVLLESHGPHIMDCAVSEVDPNGPGVTWMSPERFRGAEASPAADVFAWGAVIAFAGTGRLPFGPGEPEEIARRAESGDHNLTGLVKGLVPVVKRALDPDPEARPSLREVIGAVIAVWQRENGREDAEVPDRDRLAALLEREWSAVEPAQRVPRVIRLEGRAPRERSLRKPIMVGAGALAVVLVGAGVWGVSRLVGPSDDEALVSDAVDEEPAASPSPEEPRTLVVRFDPAEQEEVLEGPWVYTPVDRDDEPERGQGVPTHQEWAEQWEEAGEADDAVISPEAEVLCAKFCAAPEHVFLDEEGRGTWELTGRDFIDYLSWGPVVIVEVTFSDEEPEGDGPREIVGITELFTD
ncbi:serine/threonine-protein kinase [Nocardiopsis sp. N85]|uniref:serine/threonine protein kinase n=1 Tax=Nocardiopsis sp. N85 TaxID=3029400 RepID=UPI00237FCFB4|nr:serine/threonine-protein kinase [Nocardiopsis sp. N85]MDE3724305.1 serine/threonine-protein kinase [Nocardiopsis sp. N85]